MRAVFAVAGLALAVSGCEKAQADHVEKSETTIDDRGARPQYLLRYEIPEGFEQYIDEIVDVELHMSGAQNADMVMPRMVMAQTFSIDKVDARGRMHLTSDTTSVRIEDDARMDPRVASGMAAQARALEGMQLSATLLPDGRTKGLRVDLSTLPASARQMSQQLEQAIDQMVPVLPDVSVGIGARWTVDQTIRMSNMRMFVTSKYEILAISEDHATLHIDLEMTAPPQPVVSSQGTAHLDALIGSGSYDMELDLHQLVDHLIGVSQVGMTMSAGGQSFDLDITTGLQVLPTGDTPEPRK